MKETLSPRQRAPGRAEKKEGRHRMESVRIRIPNNIARLLQSLSAAGHDAFLVGGSLRDALLGMTPHDFDIATSATPPQVMALFEKERVIPTGLAHGTVTVLSDGEAVEITTFRTDGAYADGRHPLSVAFTRRIEDDLARRDFTVNAMAYNEARGLVDLFGGRQDLARRCIRCVGDPETRFSEDSLRILRAFRFAAQLGFSIDEATYRAALALGDTLARIARERIGVEFLRLLSSPLPGETLERLAPLLGQVLPGIEVPLERLRQTDRLAADPILRLAFLLCRERKDERFSDLSPGESRREDGAVASAAHSLRLSGEQKQRLARLADLPSPDRLAAAEAPAVRRWMAQYGADFPAVLSESALLGCPTERARRLWEQEAPKHPCLSLADLAVNGRDLTESGLAAGRAIGPMLHFLLEAVLDDPSKNEKETLLKLAAAFSAGLS